MHQVVALHWSNLSRLPCIDPDETERNHVVKERGNRRHPLGSYRVLLLLLLPL